MDILNSEEALAKLHTFLKNLGAKNPDDIAFETGSNPVEHCFQFDATGGELDLLKSKVTIPGLDKAWRIIFKVPYNLHESHKITWHTDQ